MARVPPLDYEQASAPTRAEYDRQMRDHGRITNMKRTLGHSPAALKALMEWYPLRAEVVPFLGDRATTVFTHSISSETDCLICSTFFRRLLIESGENPDTLKLDEREALLVEYGRQLVKDPNQVSDALYGRLAGQFTPPQIVALTTFAGLMIATNVFNNALQVDLDGYLEPFRKKAP